MVMSNSVYISESEGRAKGCEEQGSDSRLRVTVVFTTVRGTLSALCAASGFAKNLGARLALVAVEVVPYRLALTEPAVPLEFVERRMLSLVSKAGVEADAVSIEIWLCRDRRQCLREVLIARSLVVVGGKNSRWSKERKLEKWLTSLGHRVVLVDVAARHPGKSLLPSYQKLLRVLGKNGDSRTKRHDETVGATATQM
jgi:hypothetical protein